MQILKKSEKNQKYFLPQAVQIKNIQAVQRNLITSEWEVSLKTVKGQEDTILSTWSTEQVRWTKPWERISVLHPHLLWNKHFLLNRGLEQRHVLFPLLFVFTQVCRALCLQPSLWPLLLKLTLVFAVSKGKRQTWRSPRKLSLPF